MQCPDCQRENDAAAKFCGECGAKLARGCSACGSEVKPTARYCSACGARQGEREALPPAEVHEGAESFGSQVAQATPPDAERRHLTVMFSDLVGSTALAQRLDDEDLREVMRGYYDACAETVRRYEGYIANYLGDGLLVYFGYPRAHEDDSERAVRAALDMLAQLTGELNGKLEVERGHRLAARIGIHTGPVVVGDLGRGARGEAMALGETVNMAARLQTVAAPDAVVISAATRRLVRGIFVLEDLGPQRLKGIAEPVVAYRVLQPTGVRSRLDLGQGTLTPFVGRELELGVLLDRWERVEDREGQTVLVVADPGVGKSRLIYQLRERLADEPHTWLECRCSPYTEQSALQPVIELLQQGLSFQPVDTAEEKIGKLERALRFAGLLLPETVPLFAELLSVPLTAAYQPVQMSAEVKRRKTLEALVAWILALGEVQPVMVLVEDLHWCDPSSLELLGQLIEQAPTARLMLVCTARPEFEPPWPPRSSLTPMHLSRLTKRKAQEMLEGLSSGRSLPEAVVAAIVARADGIALYVEELAHMVLESGLVVAREGGYELLGPLKELAIPATLQDSLMARLDRLSAAKEVAQRAAVCGREFSYGLLMAIAELDEPTLRQGLARLAEAELLFHRGEPPDATYTFKHALIQEAAYQSLLKRTQQTLHARVARVLEERFPERAATEPEVVARHYEAAGLAEPASAHYLRAGAQAAERSAHGEAIVHLRKGLALLETLPESAERSARDIQLQLTLAPSLAAVRGYSHPETEAAYERARAVSDATSDRARLGSALVGLSMLYSTRGEIDRGMELAERLLEIARATGDEALLLAAQVRLAFPQYFQGKFVLSLEGFDRAVELYDPSRHYALASQYMGDQGVIAHGYAAWSLWFLGYPDRALCRAREAVELGRKVAHPFSLILAICWEAALHSLRRDPDPQRVLAAEAIALSEAQSFPLWLGLGKAFHGAALAAAAATDSAVTEVAEGVALAAGTGNQAGAPFLIGLLAEAHRAAGHYAEALSVAQMGLAVSEQTGQRFWDAELHRLMGDVLLQSQADCQDEIERFYDRALEIARAQNAKSLELRALMSLTRFRGPGARAAETRSLLSQIHSTFTEGFDTRDLREATVLLEQPALR
jgi:class 3 adenylate cyclase